MKRAVVAAMVLSLVFVVPGFAAESNEPPKGPAPTFEQRKAQILKGLDQQSTQLKQKTDCVKAAKSDDDLKACRRKQGSPYGPGGMGRPGGPIPPGGKTPE